jgi:hypothetical protein
MLASVAHYGAYRGAARSTNKALPSFRLAANFPCRQLVHHRNCQLTLRCNPGQILFLPDNLNTPSGAILVDALVRNQAITGAQPLNPI